MRGLEPHATPEDLCLGDRTGIWHETYLVRAGEYEAVYGNMPTFGLAAASNAVTVTDSVGARGRLKAAVQKAVSGVAGLLPGLHSHGSRKHQGPETLRFRAFWVVAGAGFEPATFGS